MTLLNIPDDFECNLNIDEKDNRVKFTVGDLKTAWLDLNDRFIERIQFENLNQFFIDRHLSREISAKNLLDEGIGYLGQEKYPKAVRCFDDVIWYDDNYGEALFYKSKALFSQGHFVKSLRNYKNAVKADSSLKDIEYHRLLLKKSSEERDSFPKIKQNIYTGDEYFAKGEFEKAIESYDKALVNPSKFKDKILYKLLNKKATALLKLSRFDGAYECFSASDDVFENDYANFGMALSLYRSQSDSERILDCLSNASDISKKQLIEKSQILCDIGEFKESLLAADEFLDNHFKVDKDYIKALKLKAEILDSLGQNSENINVLIVKFKDSV